MIDIVALQCTRVKRLFEDLKNLSTGSWYPVKLQRWFDFHLSKPLAKSWIAGNYDFRRWVEYGYFIGYISPIYAEHFISICCKLQFSQNKFRILIIIRIVVYRLSPGRYTVS